MKFLKKTIYFKTFHPKQGAKATKNKRLCKRNKITKKRTINNMN